MTKKLSIFLIAVLTVASLAAQPAERSGSAVYAPRAGQVQLSVVLGSGLFFESENLNYLLPSYLPSAELGLDPTVESVGKYLHLGSLNDNSIANIAGIQTKVFLTNRLALNALFAMNIDVTPEKDYTEGVTIDDLLGSSVSGLNKEDLVQGGVQWVEGRLTDKYIANVGLDFYFNNCNGRLFPYVGVVGGFQHARVQAYMPYTGIEIGSASDPIEIYALDKRAGEAYAISGAITCGVEYNLLPGMNIALEVRPFNYYYSAMRMYADGLEYNADMIQFKFFAFPQLKIGFRF